MNTKYPMLPSGGHPESPEALAYAVRCAERAEAIGLTVDGIRGVKSYDVRFDITYYRADIIAHGSSQLQVGCTFANPAEFLTKSTRAVTLRLRQCL